MKSRWILLPLLAACAGGALAQYKCTAANGAVSFQQSPCVGAKSEQRLNVIPNGHPPAATGAEPPAVEPAGSVDKRMQAGYERQRERDALAQALKSAQDEQSRRAQQRLADIAGARRQIGDDPANAPSLRDALASIDSRYKALDEIDQSRIKTAQAALDDWDRSAPAR